MQRQVSDIQRRPGRASKPIKEVPGPFAQSLNHAHMEFQNFEPQFKSMKWERLIRSQIVRYLKHSVKLIKLEHLGMY